MWRWVRLILCVCVCAPSVAHGSDAVRSLGGVECRVFRRWEFKVEGFRGAHWLICRHDTEMFGAALTSSGRVLCPVTGGVTNRGQCQVWNLCGHEVAVGVCQ
jgi:hypothetical protein